MKCLITITLILLFSTVAYAQTTWYVPDDFPKIQGAISSSSVVDGDTVIVRSGTYEENIDFSGKDVVVKGADGAAVTVIDGGKLDSVVTFQSGETAAAVLEGFTLTNGSGTVSGSKTYGGGVYCLSSSPLLFHS